MRAYRNVAFSTMISRTLVSGGAAAAALVVLSIALPVTAANAGPAAPAGAITVGASGFPTIQSAIDAAAVNAVITVPAGTYTEALTINKPLTLLGAEHGVDARGRAGDETIIESTGDPISYNASGSLTVDGFTLRTTNPAPESNVVWAQGDTRYTFTNNVIVSGGDVDTAWGLHFSGATSADITHNDFTGAGGNTGAVGFSNGRSHDISITENAFHNNGVAINTLLPADPGTPLAGGVEGLTVTGNTSTDDGNFLVSNDTAHAVISDNVIIGATQTALYFSGTNDDIQVTGNTITGGSGLSGVKILDQFAGTRSNFVISGNTITGKMFGIYVTTGSAVTGVAIDDNIITGSLVNGIWLRSGTGYTGSNNQITGTLVVPDTAAAVPCLDETDSGVCPALLTLDPVVAPVTPATTDTTTVAATGTSDELAATGFEAWWYAAVAAALLALGFGAFAMRRVGARQ